MSAIIGADAAKLAGLQVDLLTKIRNGNISLDDLQRFVRGELAVVPEPQRVESTVTDKVPQDLPWAKVYDLLGMKGEYDGYMSNSVPNQPGYWTELVIQGVTCNKVVAALRKADVQVYLYTEDLDASVTDNHNRAASYAVSFKATVEADEENANQSANQRKKKGCTDITLLERLLLEMAFFLATGNHLDVENVTLCSGSRGRLGYVPGVDFDSGGGKVSVGWYDPGSRDGGLRARSAVSLPAQA